MNEEIKQADIIYLYRIKDLKVKDVLQILREIWDVYQVISCYRLFQGGMLLHKLGMVSSRNREVPS